VICLLLECGHSGVYDYGLGWFYAITDTVAEISKDRAKAYERTTD